MKTEIKGKVIVLGDNIDTDQIYPGRYLELVKPEDIRLHSLEGVDPNISKGFKPGDIVIAGRNFGCGSSREHAPIALISMGASLIIADSFARIFFRNSINLGLPLIICKGISKRIEGGQEISVKLLDGTITILASGETIQAERLSEHTLEILKSGGIKPMMRKKYGVKE